GALRLPPAGLAAGADVRLARLDLARVLRGAPATSLSLEARGHVAGTDLATLRGAVTASLAASRLRAGHVERAELRASADRGLVEVTRLEASLPGGAVRAAGRWRRGGEVAGHAAVEGTDLAALRRNLEALLGQPLPALAGSGHVEAELSGTDAAPAASVRVQSPALALAGVSGSGIALAGRVAGPLSAPRATVEGTVARLLAGGLDARALRLAGRVEGRAAEVSVTGAVPELGPDALAVRAAASLSEDGRAVALSALTLAWPGDRFELQGPATVRLDGPSVDRFVLAAGAQRVALSGGITGRGRRRAVEATADVEALDLGLLPRALLPASLGLGGRATAHLTAKGALSAPELSGRVELAEAAVMGMQGLSAAADLRYDGAARRARVELGARRAAGGELEVRADLPTLLARAGAAAPLAAKVTVSGFPVREALRLAAVEPPGPLEALASLEVSAGGTVGAPTLEATAALEGARYGELDGLALRLRLQDDGDEAKLTAALDHAGARALDVEAAMPLALSELLRDPAAVARGLADARLTAAAAVPGLDLATVAGRQGVPADLRGRADVRAEVGGTLRAPRGRVTATLADGAVAGYRRVAAEVALAARDGATELQAKLAIEGEEVARLSGTLALPVERLGAPGRREAAPLAVRLDIPHADLRRAGAPVLLAGELAGRAEVAGTLAAPRIDVDLTGRRLEIEGHPLGDLAVKARSAGRALHADLHLAVAAGGTLDGALDADADLGLPALRRGDLGRAPARAKLVASELDLGFLPAIAPGLVRSASGKIGVDLVASGPLARPIPRGTVAMAGGRLAIAELGDWTEIALQASLSDDVFRVDHLRARRGGGKLDFKAEARGLSRGEADLTAELTTSSLVVARAGQEVATVDVHAQVSGKASAQALTADLTIPSARVKLPDRTPRKIQPLDRRDDIVIRSFRKKPVVAAALPTDGARRPYHATVHLLVPGRFVVRSDTPRVDVELKADVTAEYEEGETALTGDVETLRGQVEPIGGRIFDVKRGRVHFTGSELGEATLEVQALYDNPAAKVTVAVGGTLDKPEVKLTSEPAMDESQIALLLATGHTELKAGTGGVDRPPAQEAGYAALGAVSQQAFKDLIADKLPVDMVSLDPTQLRAGKYVTDKIYVGYTRRFNAQPEQGENTNEARVEYQISPRWNFEVRYGDANTGGASLIWSMDY
ncbi:MAG TPA: translocation/assembly module TamB domain-containing protein, partial [Anaeromyxobacteraceae bacterium]